MTTKTSVPQPAESTGSAGTISELAASMASTHPPAPSSSMAQSVLGLRVTQDFAAEMYGVPVLTAVQVAKPPKAYFFRAKGGEAFATNFYTLDASRQGGEGIFACSPQVAQLLADQVRLVQIRLAVTSQGTPYLIPVPLPGPDGRWNAWHLSLARALEIAETSWIRISANQQRGGYDVFRALGDLAEPQWPHESFEELLEIGFRGRLITAEDHPLVQQLLGAA